ncbi:hypothetical protein ACDT16_13845, partial [Staphylococcus aureus]
YFVVPARNKGQKSIVFGRAERPQRVIPIEPEPEHGKMQLHRYTDRAKYLIKKMGYDLTKCKCLNHGKGRRLPLRLRTPQGKAQDYYHRTGYGLGYITPESTPDLLEEEVQMHSHSSDSSTWDSDNSIGQAFKEVLSVNMASADPPIEEDQLMEFFEDEPWAQRLGSQWEMRFEQREPPTMDQVVQIDLGTESSPKPIFISES